MPTRRDFLTTAAGAGVLSLGIPVPQLWQRVAAASERQADLRLDTKAGAMANLGGYSAIVPGNVEASALISRIIHKDPEERMPPADSARTLSDDQID